jgi:hypothetical protein
MMEMLLFLVAVTIIGVAVVAGLTQTISNAQKPLESSQVLVVAKRTHVSGGMNNTPASTHYYVTFEWENGERREYPVSGHEYGMMAEGDIGTLMFQGTWYKGFSRNRRTV